jgi:hypothetical protein
MSNAASYLRIEIWDGESIEWSLVGEGTELQYDQASIKLRSLFPEQTEIELVINKDEVRTVEKPRAMEEVRKLGGSDNIMLTDKNYTKMMIFIYS